MPWWQMRQDLNLFKPFATPAESWASTLIDISLSTQQHFCPYILKNINKIRVAHRTANILSTPLSKNMAPCETYHGDSIQGGECPTYGAKG
jgi:hypothetical protein